MNIAIETKNLTRTFRRQEAVKDLNLQISEESVFALLGLNGVGKTTTIKMLMNLLPPTSGSALVLGIPLTQWKQKDFLQIGYASENQELPAWMNVEYFLKYCKALYPTWNDSFFQKLLQKFDLPLDQKIGHLSRGMKIKLYRSA